MPSFDIVSEIEMSEVRNACENANRELATRFDFNGVDASYELIGKDIKLAADAEFQLTQMLTILRNNLVKRGIDIGYMDLQEKEFSGKRVTLLVKFKEGIEQAVAKKVVKLIKDNKLKVQAQIQGEQLRVTGKKRDDLQGVMALVRANASDLGQPFQFNNFRD